MEIPMFVPHLSNLKPQNPFWWVAVWLWMTWLLHQRKILQCEVYMPFLISLWKLLFCSILCTICSIYLQYKKKSHYQYILDVSYFIISDFQQKNVSMMMANCRCFRLGQGGQSQSVRVPSKGQVLFWSQGTLQRNWKVNHPQNIKCCHFLIVVHVFLFPEKVTNTFPLLRWSLSQWWLWHLNI